MLQPRSIQSSLGIRDKILSLDFVLIISILLLCVFLSNFVDLKFYEVDKINSAAEIYFSLGIEEGLFLEDYKLRNEIAEDKSFHYKNSQISLYDAWSKGCPNRWIKKLQ